VLLLIRFCPVDSVPEYSKALNNLKACSYLHSYTVSILTVQQAVEDYEYMGAHYELNTSNMLLVIFQLPDDT